MIKHLLNLLTGTKPARKDILLSKECRLFMSVDNKTGIVVYAAKGNLNDRSGWGRMEFHLQTRLEMFKGKYKFVPDEKVCCWRFDNIDKTPNIDEKYQAFVDFLKGRKPEMTASLREYAFRQELGLKDREQLPGKEFVSWCNVQDSEQLKDSFDDDIAEMGKLMANPSFGVEEQGRLLYFMNLYKDNDQYLPRFLKLIEEIEDKDKRLAVYKTVEPVIENSDYYVRKGAGDIQTLMHMDEHDIRSVHILNIELLCDEMGKKTGGRFSLFPSQMTENDLSRLKMQQFRYHKLIGKMSVEEEQMDLERSVASLREDLKELFIRKGIYKTDGTDGTQHNRKSGDDSKVQTPEANAEKNPTRTNQGMGTSVLDLIGKGKNKREVAPATGKVAENQPEAKDFNVRTEITESLKRLEHGTLLRKEIDRYKDYPEITEAQLDWAFRQPYITEEILISNGTMVGSVLSTRFFEELNRRIESYSGEGENLFSSVEERVISAYATILSNDIDYYSGQIKKDGSVMAGSIDYQDEIMRMILSNRSILIILKPLLQQLREVRENERLNQELDQTHAWLEVLYSDNAPEVEKDATVEKLVALIYLRHDNLKYFNNLLLDVDFFNERGNPSFLFTQLAIRSRLPEYSAQGVAFRSPALLDVVEPEHVTWMDALVARIHSGLMRYDLIGVAKNNSQKVMGVCAYFEENGKKIPLWIDRDLALKNVEENQAKEKSVLFAELADFMRDCLHGGESLEPFRLKERLLELEERYGNEKANLLAALSKKKGKSSLKVQTSPLEEMRNDEDRLQESRPVDDETGEYSPESQTFSDGSDQGIADLEDEHVIRKETDDYGLSNFDSTGIEADAYEPTDVEVPEIDDDTLNRNIDTGQEENAMDDAGQADSSDPLRPVYFVPNRDGGYPNPFAAEWSWEASHLYARMGDDVRGFFTNVKESLFLRFLCMSKDDVGIYMSRYEVPEETRRGIETISRCFTSRNKSWKDSENQILSVLYEHLGYIANFMSSGSKNNAGGV